MFRNCQTFPLKALTMARKRGLETSGGDEPRPSITDIIKNFNCLETAARSSGGEIARVQGGRVNLPKGEKAMVVVKKPVEMRKRKLETEMNLLEGSGKKKRCSRTTLTQSESERDKPVLNHYKTKLLLTSKEPVAGAAIRGGQGSPYQGEGDVLGQDSGCSPETHARF